MPMIIVLDDSPTRRLALRQSLVALGHHVQCHDSLGKILDTVDARSVDLVLMALVMDEGNGFDGGTTLRARGFASVVLLADGMHATDEIWAQAQGLQGVAPWPVAQAALQRIIEKALRVRPGQGGVCDGSR